MTMCEEPLLITDVPIYQDISGSFYKSYQYSRLMSYGIDFTFIQDNNSISKKNVIRGLHYQWDKPMGKLVRVCRGSIMDVVVDIKKDSQTFGKSFVFYLSEQNNYQLWIPPHYAHGFLSLTDNTHTLYKCTNEYNKSGESGINPLDKTLNIDWKIPYNDMIISDKDINAQTFIEYQIQPKF